jgi:hypothetical protein
MGGLLLIVWAVSVISCWVIIARMIHWHARVDYYRSPWPEGSLAVGLAGLSVCPIINTVLVIGCIAYRLRPNKPIWVS